MKAFAVILPLTMSLVSSIDGRGSEVLARFRGGIGVQPVLNVSGQNPDGTFANVTRNIVRGVNPAGPWRIDDLKEVIQIDGHIRVSGRGLLLAGGNRIGQNAGQRVFATLICDEAAPFVERSTATAGVPLETNGDFEIDDVLDPVPSDCASPVLLIRAASNQTWFAAGILQ